MLTLRNPEPTKQGGASKWKTGQSGNPRGRRAGYDGPNVAELARSYTLDAVHALVLATKHPATRVPAAIALLDRGWGKPEVRIHSQSEQTVLHLVAAMAQGDDLLQTMAKPPTIEHQQDDIPKE